MSGGVFCFDEEKRIFDVKVDVQELLGEKPQNAPKIDSEQSVIPNQSNAIKDALTVISRQMKIIGNRSRTISDYILHIKHFRTITNVKNVSDITVESIYHWLDSMNVSTQTKLAKLKCFKAFLSRCFDKGLVALMTLNILKGFDFQAKESVDTYHK